MATSMITSSIQHDTDANFRLWAKQVSDQLAAVGLVKTADTGQIDFATAVRPTTNTAAGYEIWRFSDLMQATRPIFIKLEYGTFGAVNHPGMWITVGNGSNGAGTISNVQRPRTQMGRNAIPSVTATSSYCSYSTALGQLVFAGWTTSNGGTAPAGMFFFAIARPADDAGALLEEGTVFYELINSTTGQSSFSHLTGTGLYGGVLTYTLVVGGITSTNYSADIQLFRHFVATPRIRNVPGLITYLDAEITRGGSFTTTVFGTARTFMPLGGTITNASPQNVTTHVLAMLWE